MADKKETNKEQWQMPKTRNYSFNQHKDCEWFPCHQGIDLKDFNCLFCFCPLYALGKECGGKFSYQNKEGIKDCSACLVPHQRQAYDHMLSKCKILVERSKRDND